MSSAWLLPEHLADVLPAQARHIEELRRDLLDIARRYGCELVMPPMLEHIESLLSGTGGELDLKTFKLVDQLSGRTLGIRADSTPQVARIDAHLLNRAGLTRLCYCGPILHALPSGLMSTREPLQFGAEFFGHRGLEADLEVQELSLDCLRTAGVEDLLLDLGDARILRAILAEDTPDARLLAALQSALAAKDVCALRDASGTLPPATRAALSALVTLYGDGEVIERAARLLPDHPLTRAALADLRRLAGHARQSHPDVRIGFDLADSGGNPYYTGAHFAVFATGSPDAIARGGRYDEVGSVFGRNRPAVGFSLDLKSLALLSPARPLNAAIRAPWAEDAGLRSAVRRLRDEGETVVRTMPGHDEEAQEFACDRELVCAQGLWSVRPLSP